MMSADNMEQNNRSVNLPAADTSEKNDYSSIYGMSAPDSSSAALGETGRIILYLIIQANLLTLIK